MNNALRFSLYAILSVGFSCAAAADTVTIKMMDKGEIARVVKQYGKMGSCVKNEIARLRSEVGPSADKYTVTYPKMGDNDMKFLLKSPNGKYDAYCATDRWSNTSDDWATYD